MMDSGLAMLQVWWHFSSALCSSALSASYDLPFFHFFIHLLQTTNNYYNNSLLQYIVPQSMFAWQRVRIANALASDAKSWHELLGRFNSGTYNK